MDDEQATTRPQDPLRIGDLVGRGAAEARPVAHDDVGRGGGRVEGCGSGRRGRRDAGAQRLQLPRPQAAGAVDDEHVTVGDRAQGLEGARDLALDVEGIREACG
jgi:hypothetical protein